MSDEQKKQSNKKNKLISNISLVLSLPNVVLVYFLIGSFFGIGDPDHYLFAIMGFLLVPYALSVGIIAVLMAGLTYRFITSKISLVINAIPLLYLLVYEFVNWT